MYATGNLPDEIVMAIIEFSDPEETISMSQPSGIGQRYLRPRPITILFRASLMLVSKQMYRLAKTLLYRDLVFSMPWQISKFLAAVSCPSAPGTPVFNPAMRTVTLVPKGDRPFEWLDRADAYKSYRSLFKDVVSVSVIIRPSVAAISLDDPELYLNVIGIFNPTTLRIVSEIGPMWDEEQQRNIYGSLIIEELALVLVKYDRLETLEVAYLDFEPEFENDPLEEEYEEFLEAISRLPLRKINLFWPRGLTSSVVADLLHRISKDSESHGLTITATSTHQPPDSQVQPSPSIWFRSQNHEISLHGVTLELQKRDWLDHLGFLKWEVQEEE